MIVQKIQCNSCGTLKQQTNHWWAIERSDRGIIVLPLAKMLDPLDERIEHYCGQKCALAAVQQYMDAQLSGQG